MYQISVIIPVYNQEKYLEDCLDSLVNQTIGIDNIEVIIVNDKSTDNSLDILEKYSSKYSSFKIINQSENKGAGIAKNTAMKHVTSEYLTFLDSDDIIDKDFIEKSLNLIKNNNCDLLISNWKIFPDDEQSIHKPNISHDKIINSIEERPSLIFATSTGSKIFSKNLYKYLNFSDILYDDNTVSVETLLNANKIFLSKNNGYHYRKNLDSVTKNITLKNPLDLIISIKNLFKLFNNYKSESQYIKLLILKFVDDILFWLYNYEWFKEEELEIVRKLQNSILEFYKEDIDFFNNYFSLLYPEDIINLKKYDSEMFLAMYKYYLKQAKIKPLAKLYIDSGNDFNELETIKVDYTLVRDNIINFKLDNFDNIKRLRFDPIEDEFTKIKISSIESDAKEFKIIDANCDNNLDEDYQIFTTIDPYYIIDGDFNNSSYINFKFNLHILDNKDLNSIFANKTNIINEYINENTGLKNKFEEFKSNSKKGIFNFKRN